MDSTQQELHWNDSSATLLPVPDRSIHQLFEEQVQSTPRAVALSDGNEQFTYQQLNARANQLARKLLHLGIGSEQSVGLCLPRSLDLVVGLLAILKAGATYVPLDPTYPRDRLNFVLQDANLSTILTNRDLLGQMSFEPELTLCLDTPGLAAEEEVSNLTLEINNEQLAYIIYTSGSTGRPKGVCISHRSVVVFLAWVHQQFSAEELSSVLFATSICFDLSIFELFAPLSRGGRAVLARTVLDLPLLSVKEPITLLNTVPSAASTLLNSGALPLSVLTVNLAGEALTRELVQALYRQPGVQRVCNLYGPTEDTTYSTWAVIGREEQGTVSIGRPLLNTQAYILDDSMQPVPPGSAGELYLGGDGQARGYLNRPDLTAERFVPDPFSTIPGRRLYRTGDLASYRSNGMIDFLGRRDHQVKIRGFRIELGEIEAQLCQHPAVAQAIVLAWENRPGEKDLVAYAVARPSSPLDVAMLRQYLQEQLPAYMLPTFFVLLEHLPLTVNGKVDRQALPLPGSLEEDASVSSCGSQPVAARPKESVEEALARIWRTILRIPVVGRTENFFEIGGHSLLAMQVLAALRQQMQISLTIHQFFAAPTIAELAIVIAAKTLAQPESEKRLLDISTPLVPVARTNDLPLSFAQQRLWFLDQLEGSSATYNIPVALLLNGPFNIPVFQQCMHEIVRRHEILRTSFPSVRYEPVQLINTYPTVAIEVVEFPIKDVELQRSLIQEDIQSEACRPFDLAQDPLLRVRILLLNPQQHVLIFTMHHIISDRWSISLMAQELSTLYREYLLGQPSSLAELSVQYADFAVWQRTNLQGARLATHLNYWKKQLTRVPALSLPTDHPRNASEASSGAACSQQWPLALKQQLILFSQNEGVTPFMTLLTVFVTLLAHYSNQEDITVGTPVANRPHPELEKLIGFFVNTLALRIELSGNPTGRELLQRVRMTALDAYEHQDIPFERVIEAVRPPREAGRSPLFQAFFVFQNTPMADLTLTDVQIESFALHTATAKFDLSVEFKMHDEGLTIGTEYNARLFELATI
ncbi:MAG TPA: amino acid adenylation domain-containing protein, partial [Ktedonobacteraceae bacterium]|nr:amino acid adenylation domain-containing protein [Ktedonobacteraceae bacterium]